MVRSRVVRSTGVRGHMRGRWVAKAVIQKAISFLPDPQRANRLFQHHVTRSTTLDEAGARMRLDWALLHLRTFRRLGDRPDRGFSALELGAGWYPVVPLTYFLAGADRVWMVDLEDLCRPELAVQAVDAVLRAHDRGHMDELGAVDPDRVARLRRAREEVTTRGHVAALGALGLQVTPTDARTMVLPEPPDLISSNTVLEHIPPDVLFAILRRFGQISRPGTVMSHLVDLCDHYAYVDPEIGVHHFLRFSDRVWRLIDNDVQPMNRLRAPDYRDMYTRLGLPLTEEHREGCDPSALEGEPLAERFAAMPPADVACTSTHLVSVMERVGAAGVRPG